jgi:hypothetical protein
MMYDVVEVSKDVAEVLYLVVGLLSFSSVRFSRDFSLYSVVFLVLGAIFSS